MSGTNRYVDGEKNIIMPLISGGVTVEIGDLMFLDNLNNLRNDGNSTANYYAYPLEYFRTSGASLTINRQNIKSSFLGVSLNDKEGISDGLDINLSIATRGRFNFDLKPSRSISVANYFGASGTTSASNLFNQKIRVVSDSDYALGYFVEDRTHAQNADVVIKTIFSLI